MKAQKTKGLLAGLLCLILLPASGLAQSDPLREAFDQYMALYEQGRYGEAQPFARKAVELGSKEFGPDNPTTAVYINDLAELYRAQGEYVEAEPLFKRALAIREKARGPDHPDVATSLNNLAELYRAQGKYAEAEPLFKRSLAIWEKALGADHPDVAQSLNNRAALYRAQGKSIELLSKVVYGLIMRRRDPGVLHLRI